MFRTIHAEAGKESELQNLLHHAVAPRPIAFASTIDEEGNVNLSPFSFFNIFSIQPPILIFSSATRVRDNSHKHTLENVKSIPEVVVNVVTSDMVEQVSLSSCEYPKGVNEFSKAGFTPLASDKIRPPRVKESPVQMECRVNEIIFLGTEGGAGNLVLAEVLTIHVAEHILDEQGRIDQLKLPLVSRLGGNWYASVSPSNLFQVAKPNRELGIGFDNLPTSIRQSTILTGNQLAKLAHVTEIPEVNPAFADNRLTEIIQYFSVDPAEMEKELQKHAGHLLDQHKVDEAWQVLLATS